VTTAPETPITIGAREALNSLIDVAKTARAIDEVLPIQMLQILLHTAGKEGITTKELMSLTGLAQSSISRNVATLGFHDRPHRPGHRLVVAVDDPTEPRRKQYYLTKKGKRIVNDLLQGLKNRHAHVETLEVRTGDEILGPKWEDLKSAR